MDAPKLPGSGEVSSGRVIFCDFSPAKFDPVIKRLKDEGMECVIVSDAPTLLDALMLKPYDVCIVNLIVGGVAPFELITTIQKKSADRLIRIIAVSRHVAKANIQNTIRAGATDFVAEPIDADNLYHRILYHLTPKHVIDRLGYENSVASEETWPYLNLLLEASDLLARTERGKETATYQKILGSLAVLMDSNRTSMMLVEAETNTAVVLATSDNPNFFDFPISVQKYPEVLHVVHTGNFVLIEDCSQNPLTHKISQQVKQISIGSMMVLPVWSQGDVVGALAIRRAVVKELPSMQTIRVVQALANIIASHSNAKFLLRRIYREFASKAG